MESIAEEILREILLKLPTRDVARGRCVCWQWRRLLTDPSFLTLHADAVHVVTGAGAEMLLVSMTNGAPGRNAEIVLFNLSSAMPMCRFADLDVEVYSPANVCNGFLCLVPNHQDAPVVVCNPVTSEKLEITGPPVVESISVEWQLFAMGFSPSTGQYKVFRLSFPNTWRDKVYLDVCTLGNNAGWRRRSLCIDSSDRRLLSWPLLIDGKLYVVTRSSGSDMLLAIDVANEVVQEHKLPKKLRMMRVKTAVDVLELGGRLCVAMQELEGRRPRLTFWVLVIDVHVVASLYKKNDDTDDYGWKLRYSFDMDPIDSSPLHCRRCERHPRGAWLHDGDGVLCYLTDGRLYMYDTKAKRQWQYPSFPAINKGWDHQLRLHPSDSPWWNVYGGYRPSLLSPRHLVSSSSLDHHNRPSVENPLLRTMRCCTPSKKRRHSPRPSFDDGNNLWRAASRGPALSFSSVNDGSNHRRAVKKRPTLSFIDDI